MICNRQKMSERRLVVALFAIYAVFLANAYGKFVHSFYVFHEISAHNYLALNSNRNFVSLQDFDPKFRLAFVWFSKLGTYE